MHRFLAAVTASGWLVASLLSTQTLEAQSASDSARGAPKLPAGWWNLRVPLDSGEVRVEVTSRAAAVTVVAPTGTFLQAFATSRPLAEWADAAEALPARAGEGSAAPIEAAQLTRGGGNPTAFTLTRAPGGDAAGYALSGTNGAWPFTLSLSPAQAGALLGALRGDPDWGALPYDYPRKGTTRDQDVPDVSGAWHTHQVDRTATLGTKPPRPKYPTDLRDFGMTGVVRLQFIVDSTGRVVPSSIRLIGPAHPVLATAARDALLVARYKPAERGRRPVAQVAMQDFEFKP